MVVVLIIVFAALSFIDVPWLIKKKYSRELVVYLIIMALAFAVALLQVLDIDFPNPVKEFQHAVKGLFKLLHLTYD